MEIIEGLKETAHQARVNPLERAVYPLFDTFVAIKSAEGPFLLRVFVLLEFAQVAALSFFSEGSRQFEGSTLSSWVGDVADAVLIFPYLPDNATLYLILGACILAVSWLGIVLCALPLIFRSVECGRRRFFQLAFYLVGMESTIFYLPFLGIAVLSLKCKTVDESYKLYLDSSVKCFGPEHVPLFCVALVGLCGLLPITFLYKLFVFVYEPLPNCVCGKLSPVFDVAFHSIRTIEIVLLLIYPEPKPKLLFSVVEACCLIGIFVCQLKCDITYRSETRRFVKTLAGAGAWIGVIELVVQFTDKFQSALLGAVIFCGIAVAVYFSQIEEKDDDFMRFLPLREGRKKIYVHDAIRELITTIELKQRGLRGGNVNDYGFTSYLGMYSEYTIDRVCLAKELANKGCLYPDKHRAEMIDAILFCINRRFKEILIRDPESVAIRLLYVGFLIYHARNYILAWEINEGTRGQTASIIQRLQIYCYRRRLKEIIFNKPDFAVGEKAPVNNARDNSIAPLEMTVRSRDANKACRLIEQNTLAFSQFWDTLQDRRPSYERFVLLGFAFLKINKQIRNLWRKITASSMGNIPDRLVYLYTAYAEEILQDDRKASAVREYLDQPELLVQDDALLQHMGTGNSVVGISADARELGKIKNFNAAFCELTGYTKDELRNTQLEKLLPPLYREAHERIFEDRCCILNGGMSVEPVENETFILHKSQYIVPIYMQIVATPNYTNNYCFLVKLKKRDSAVDYSTYHIITDAAHLLTGVSANVYSLFNLDVGTLRAAEINMTSILPESASIAECVPTITRLFMPVISSSTTPVPAELRMVQRRTSMCISINTIHMQVVCEWRRIRLESAGVIGYHYIITKAPEEPTPMMLLEREVVPEIRPKMEFAFSQTLGRYYLQDLTEGQAVAPIRCPSTERSHRRDNERLEEFRLVLPPRDQDGDRYSKFYTRVLPQLEKVCELTGDSDWYEKVAAKPNYEREISTWRVGERGFVRKQEDPHDVQTDVDPLAGLSESSVPSKADSSYLKKTEYIVKTTLKNKENMKKLLKSMPMPWVFVRLVLVCTFVMLVSIITIMVIYVIFSGLFDTIIDEIRMMYNQMDMCSVTFRAAFFTLQMITRNSGLVALNCTYPAVKSTDELYLYTREQMKAGISEIKNCFSVFKDSKYKSLTEEWYDGRVQFNNNGSDIMFTGISLLTSYELELEYLIQISQFQNASAYKYSDPAISSMFFNLQSGIFSATTTSFTDFIQSVYALYDSKLNSMIVLACILGSIFILLVAIQAPTVYNLNKLVCSQIDIFLRMPLRACIKLEKHANEFINRIQESNFEPDHAGISGQNSQMQSPTSSSFGNTKATEEGQNDHTSVARRVFYKTVWVRWSFLWRIFAAFAVPAGIICAMYTTAFQHYAYMHDQIELCNNSIRVDLIAIASKYLENMYYYDSTSLVEGVYPIYMVMALYNLKFAEIINSINEHLEKTARYVSEPATTNYVDFLRLSMCTADTPSYCGDTVAEKGYLTALSEIVWLQRYIRLTYVPKLHRTAVFNTKEYMRILKLYFDFVRPGAVHIYQNVMNEVNSKTDEVKRTLLIEAVMITVFSVLFFLFIWLPYVKSRRKELTKLRMLILFMPTGAISKVKELREYFTNILFRQKT